MDTDHDEELKALLEAEGPGALVLDDEQYRRIVAPVFRAATEMAAARNDPDLVNDMASMIALRVLVGRFGDFYLAEHVDCPLLQQQAIRQAPENACVMPLQRAGMEGAQLRDCLWALTEATKRLTWADVVGMETTQAKVAWDRYAAGDEEAGLKELKIAAATLINKIDRWELIQNRAEAAEREREQAARH